LPLATIRDADDDRDDDDCIADTVGIAENNVLFPSLLVVVSCKRFELTVTRRNKARAVESRPM